MRTRQQKNCVIANTIRCLSVVHGNINTLAPKVKKFVEENAALFQPDHIHICDGTEAEHTQLLSYMHKEGILKPLTKYENW